ncbi:MULTISPECIES: LuxR C-terminal-related transcriptional regulator [Lysobacter]|jgi:DNA-binding NarL/FixJ family response regulator|uniref:Response regulator transcription factor n=1 Tax=Lysobacter gummosus TaxID=262324 RepID=A0ABY3X6N2_9GAMM|nr:MULTISPECIES: response regulator transcription factor [Lysobacter]ALN92662.1 bacterial regulatory, luxR family protein [Lysobacter gummosus]UJB20507.1 response regulator transcription factor [Lysobacter capsici]UJQ30379.1 response regulator transcription factor [Lysobacter gummosus]UNP28229.1 response regulator transcription factor [Lysobacter gummosus]
MSATLRLLIADDHPMFRAALRYALGEIAPGAQIVEVASQSALEAAIASGGEFDLAMLDLMMPGAMGFSSLVYARGERPELPVVIISSNEHPRTIRRAQQFGASGFVPKSAPSSVLGEAVNAVLAGEVWFPSQKADRDEGDAQLADRLAQLTPQQMRVLLRLADGLLNKQIAYELSLAENTVKIHVTAILRKLGCHSRTQAAVLVKGLALDEDGAGLHDDALRLS